MKVLNLYAGIGGNRKLWAKECKVTAVEIDPEIIKPYKDFFPYDKIIRKDAHKYLLGHHKDFDFIWSSPPCQTHSSFRKNICVEFRGTSPAYPDMRLYQEILFLEHHFKGKWVVENVNPYYEPLIPAKKIQRHLFWSNFNIIDKEFQKDNIRKLQIKQLQKLHDFDLSKYRFRKGGKRQILRNCVLPELGLHVFNCAFKDQQKVLI